MLKRIADDIWGHEKAIRLPGGMMLPSRATVIRLPEDGSLAIHSPLAIDDETAKAIDALGDVRFIVAPSCVHWMFAAAAKDRYPKARIFGATGLEKKLRGVSFEPLPADGAVKGLPDALIVKRVDGAPYIGEHCFLHQPSRSLIVSDLLFNVHACDEWRMRLFFRLVGTWDKTAQSRFWRILTRDRVSAGRSALSILDWDFERVVVAHGDVVEDDARERARQALAWMTSGASHLLAAAGSVVA